jgi:prepilin-type N-terminal cleavage/methylation domain-containing protein
METRRRGERGFSLLETLVAASILTVTLAGLAQVLVASMRVNASARTITYAALLAQQKMEQLRGLTWGYDVAGLPVADTSTDLAAASAAAAGGKGLTPSPPNALASNIDGYCDFVDRFGRVSGGGTTPPRGTAYIRRWSIEPLPANPANALVLQVLVSRAGGRAARDTGATGIRVPDEARLVSVRTRKVS